MTLEQSPGNENKNVELTALALPVFALLMLSQAIITALQGREALN